MENLQTSSGLLESQKIEVVRATSDNSNNTNPNTLALTAQQYNWLVTQGRISDIPSVKPENKLSLRFQTQDNQRQISKTSVVNPKRFLNESGGLGTQSLEQPNNLTGSSRKVRSQQMQRNGSHYQTIESSYENLKSQSDICDRCGLKFSHWFHYYNDVYDHFLFYSCSEKIKVDCGFYFKFIVWLIIVPIMTYFCIIYSIFKVFQEFVFRRLDWETRDAQICNNCCCYLMLYLFYLILSILLMIIELILPIVLLPVLIFFGYFIHIFSFVKFRSTHLAYVKKLQDIDNTTAIMQKSMENSLVQQQQQNV